MEINTILQDIVNEPYETLVSMERECIFKLYPVLKEYDKKTDPFIHFVTIMATAIAIDGKITESEHKFVCDVFSKNISYEELMGFAKLYYNPKAFKELDEFIDGFPNNLKSQLALFCCCFLAVDGEISSVENLFITKLLASK